MLATASWRQALQALREVDTLHPWQLRETQMGPYLALENVPLDKAPAAVPGTGAAATATATAAFAPVLLDYHVCYSHSYQVPVVHFRAVSLDTGLPLTPDAVAALFPSWPQRPEQLVGFVGLQEHPLLPGPCWLALHPCNTGVALALALELHPAGAVAAAAATATADGAEAPAALTTETQTASTEAAAAAAAAAGGAARGGAAAARGSLDLLDLDLRTHGVTPRVSVATSAAGEDGGEGCWSPQQRLRKQQQQQGEEDALDLDELLAAHDGTGQQTDGVSSGSATAGGCAKGGGTVLGWAVVGPAGVRWPGGEVPVCPGEWAWLRRYMRAWLTLVGPHVGLTTSEGR